MDAADKIWICDQEMDVVVNKANKRKGRAPSKVANGGGRGGGDGEGPSGSDPEGDLGSCLNRLMEVRIDVMVLDGSYA